MNTPDHHSPNHYRSRQAARSPRFAELHALSHYSFLRGASHPEELVKTAASLGYEALALTDECTFAGLVKAHMAARECGIKLIVGAEFLVTLKAADFSDNNTPGSGSPGDNFSENSPGNSPENKPANPDEPAAIAKLVLLAPTRDAYGQLSALISKLRRRSEKGTYQADLDDFRWGISDCLVLWTSGASDIDRLMATGQALKRRFAQLWIALELFHEHCDLDKAASALTLSMKLDLPVVASNDVHTHSRERQPLQDLVTAIRLGTSVTELGRKVLPNGERTLRPINALQALYPVEMLEESAAIADRCTFSMEELRYEYPEELVPPHLSVHSYLRQLTLAGAAERWPDGIPGDTLNLIERELVLVRELQYEYYFLTVHDIVQFARSQGILCQGRGSAANSAVCYCLHITEVDPSRMHLLFERFVSKERNEPPDIDVDFEHERREEVIQYIYKRYGRDRAALAATLITYRPRSAIRDVGKALGMDLGLVELLAKSLAWWDKPDELAHRFRTAGLDPNSQLARQFLFFVQEIIGFPRHLSQHVGGFVISRGPLAQLVPVENAAMADRTVIQWDKYDLEALGLLKIDILALGMLTAIRKSLAALNAWRGSNLCVASIPPEDPRTYAMLQRGDSVGVFQVESRAQMAMLPRLRPQHFYDLVIEVAIVRPGPIQGDMVHPYLRRRQGLEPVEYPSDGVRRVLERTLGVPIFQEQVIELAMVAAGFSAGEADQLRRAMAAWKRQGGLEHFEKKLIDGMLERGHDRAFAERVFNQIKGFGEYGFPESHAASFALLVYVSAWLKRHEPAAFYAGLLNSLPMGFYSPSQLIQDGERHGITMLPIDVQISEWAHQLETPPEDVPSSRGPYTCDQEQPALRLGLRLVKGFEETAANRIVSARREQPFCDVEDLKRRARLDAQALRFLARAGALANLSGNRHQAHWDVAGLQEATRLQQVAEHTTKYTTQVALPGPNAAENMLDDYRYTSLTLGPHPMSLLRGTHALQECRRASDLEHCRQGQFVRLAGLVTGRQRPGTATGVVFVTLEDETGNVNVIVWSSVVDKFRAALLQAQLLRIKGVVQREGEVIHVVAGHLQDISHLMNDLSKNLPFKSRDFH